ncbi:MAG TPA: hypothetical protein VH186_09895 [Chloroflexia bacterium]|nr:hypothetical protein [Chloroflexia bacterium]
MRLGAVEGELFPRSMGLATRAGARLPESLIPAGAKNLALQGSGVIKE